MSTVDLHFLGELTAQIDFVAYFQFLTNIKGFDAKPYKIWFSSIKFDFLKQKWDNDRNRYNYLVPPIQDTKGKETQT